MDREQAVHDIIKSVLEDRFRNVNILSINVMPDIDEHGDQVLFVTVVFDGEKKRLDTKETSSLARRVLPRMEEIGDDRFPIFSFIAKSELRNVHPDSG